MSIRNKKTKIAIFLVLLLTSTAVNLAFIPQIKADPDPETLITIYSRNLTGVDSGMSLQTEHPSDNTYNSAVGMSFTATNTAVLTSVAFNLQKSGSPTALLQANLYSISGSVSADDAIPDSLIASSYDALNTSTLTTSFVTYTFHFNSENLLEAGNDYAIGLTCTSPGLSPTVNYIRFGGASSVSNETNTTFKFASGGWAARPTYQVGIWVYGLEEQTATPTPSPSPSPESTVETQPVFNLNSVWWWWIVLVVAAFFVVTAIVARAKLRAK